MHIEKNKKELINKKKITTKNEIEIRTTK